MKGLSGIVALGLTTRANFVITWHSFDDENGARLLPGNGPDAVLLELVELLVSHRILDFMRRMHHKKDDEDSNNKGSKKEPLLS